MVNMKLAWLHMHVIVKLIYIITIAKMIHACIYNIEIDCRKQTVTIVMLHCDLCKISRSLWVSIWSLHVHPLHSTTVHVDTICNHSTVMALLQSYYLGASTGLVERGCRASLAEICVLHDANLDSNAFNDKHTTTIMTVKLTVTVCRHVPPLS